MAEALNSFSLLLESVPGWIADLENILKAATDRQADLIAEYQPVEQSTKASRNASKPSSFKSRRSQDADILRASPGEEPKPSLLRPQIPHMTASDALRLAQRKRKTASVCSAEQSGPAKYRSRSLVVVYYDGDIQKKIENVVRGIGTCRNALRKGKMSAKVESLARSGSPESGSSSDEASVTIRKLGYRSTAISRNNFLSKDDGTEAFDKADGCLEKAQALCERAAHQVLRDGDCALEINNAKEHFSAARRIGDAELPELQRRAEKATERERLSEERRRVEAEREAASDEKVPAPPDVFVSPGVLEVDDLEAESDNEETGSDFVLKNFEFGRGYQLRSSRLAAAH